MTYALWFNDQCRISGMHQKDWNYTCDFLCSIFARITEAQGKYMNTIAREV